MTYEEEAKILKEKTAEKPPISVNFADDSSRLCVAICCDISPQMLQTMLMATIHASYQHLSDKAMEKDDNLLASYLMAFEQITEVFDRFIDDKKELAELSRVVDKEGDDEEVLS